MTLIGSDVALYKRPPNMVMPCQQWVSATNLGNISSSHPLQSCRNMPQLSPNLAVVSAYLLVCLGLKNMFA